LTEEQRLQKGNRCSCPPCRNSDELQNIYFVPIGRPTAWPTWGTSILLSITAGTCQTTQLIIIRPSNLVVLHRATRLIVFYR